MKKIFEFNWPEDKDEYQLYDQASNMYCALHEFAQYLREQTKYIDVENQDDIYKVKTKFYEIINEHGVNI